MKDVYKDVPGYQDVEILKIRNGSIVVDHNVIVEIAYKPDINVTEQFEEIIQSVEKELNKIVCNATAQKNDEKCIAEDYIVDRNETLPTEYELCSMRVPLGFQDFYDPVVTNIGLVCVSQCETKFDCNGGSCQLKNITGPHCLCPRTDLYMYTSPNCNGKILKSGVYGGVGASIAILLVIICIIFFLVIRNKSDKSWDPFVTSDEVNWCDEVENEWHVDRGIVNLTNAFDNDDPDSSSGSFASGRERFKANLENVDTTLQVKIQRPEVSYA
ncbi:hypothetical protein GDO81_025031 [Engystomops pustulosus]|uniref:SEA domain-containing protein n=2 Tax=Engystomops pustulosus TaxID=76066 RepID=A0AAV6ZHL4_ENGPU|nr:hypothetical protein GDO81_025031 [Engystomops pustulosus]